MVFILSDFGSSDCDFSCQHRSLGEKLLLQPLLTFSKSAPSRKNQYEDLVEVRLPIHYF